MKIVNTSFLQGDNKYYLYLCPQSSPAPSHPLGGGRSGLSQLSCSVASDVASSVASSVASNVSRIVRSVSPGDVSPGLSPPPGLTVYLPTCNILTSLFAHSLLKECLSLSDNLSSHLTGRCKVMMRSSVVRRQPVAVSVQCNSCLKHNPPSMIP